MLSKEQNSAQRLTGLTMQMFVTILGGGDIVLLNI